MIEVCINIIFINKYYIKVIYNSLHLKNVDVQYYDKELIDKIYFYNILKNK